MLRRVLSGAVVVALAVVAFSAGTAAAAESSPAPGGAFLLNGTHGYKLWALFGLGHGKGELEVFVGKHGEEALYKAEGEVSAERIDFDLGSLGRIEVERRPTGKTEVVRPCGKAQKVPGYELVGTIEFHGEEGFTEVAATHAKLRWEPLVSLVCGPLSVEGGEFGGGISGVRIKVRKKRGPALQLNQNRGSKVVYRAEVDEREGAVEVSRSVGGRLGAGALSFTPSLDSATFTGAGPFNGHATYVEAQPPRGTQPGQGAWRGNLTVDFPGATDVPLAGPGFRAGITHAHRDQSHQ